MARSLEQEREQRHGCPAGPAAVDAVSTLALAALLTSWDRRDLDRRGAGDIWTLTVQEYLQSTRSRRVAYRLARNPVMLFAIAPLYVFVIHHRFSAPTAAQRERRSVRLMNWALLATALVMSAVIGLKALLLIQLTVSAFAGALGLWLFYVQHQFEGAYWARSTDWNYMAAALQGSSFYKLPESYNGLPAILGSTISII